MEAVMLARTERDRSPADPETQQYFPKAGQEAFSYECKFKTGLNTTFFWMGLQCQGATDRFLLWRRLSRRW